MSTQVLIVGAGPVGLTMAAELARYGVAVRIVDKSAERTDKSKALVLWSRTLELLERAGCSEQFVAAGHKVLAANIIAGEQRIGHVDFDTVESPYPYALMLPQCDTERLLEEHLASLGVRVERRTEAVEFTNSPEGVTTVLRDAAGNSETLHTDWLLGCDGAHSTVRKGLGMSFLGNTLESGWILADIHLKGYPFPESEIATYWHEEGVLVSFPISPGRFRIIANVELPESGRPTDPTLEEVQAIMDRRGPGGMTASDPIWLAAFRINERKVESYREGRCFVAGDAAHVHSPAGGQGMNTGMQDAINLAWKLALVCRRTCAEKLLESYSTERSAIGHQVLTAAGRLTAVAVMKNRTGQSVRNFLGHLMFGLSPVRRALANTMTEVSIGYAESPLNGPSAFWVSGPGPGDRVSPIAEHIPIGAGSRPRFALFAEAGHAVEELVSQHADLLEPEARPPMASGGIRLVRPDGYVACVARSGDTKTIADYLTALARVD